MRTEVTESFIKCVYDNTQFTSFYIHNNKLYIKEACVFFNMDSCCYQYVTANKSLKLSFADELIKVIKLGL